MSFTHAIPFSSRQLEMLTAWGDSRPCGLEVRIATDHEELDEVAELFRFGQNYPAYCITAISTGEIDIMDADGAVDVVAGLALALAWVERQEASLAAVPA
jgi:hypothetical protein